MFYLRERRFWQVELSFTDIVAVFPSLQVNSVVVYYTIDRYKTLTPYREDKDAVGLGLFTKTIGNTTFDNITSTYKYPKGTRTATGSKCQHSK